MLHREILSQTCLKIKTKDKGILTHGSLKEKKKKRNTDQNSIFYANQFITSDTMNNIQETHASISTLSPGCSLQLFLLFHSMRLLNKQKTELLITLLSSLIHQNTNVPQTQQGIAMCLNHCWRPW